MATLTLTGVLFAFGLQACGGSAPVARAPSELPAECDTTAGDYAGAGLIGGLSALTKTQQPGLSISARVDQRCAQALAARSERLQYEQVLYERAKAEQQQRRQYEQYLQFQRANAPVAPVLTPVPVTITPVPVTIATVPVTEPATVPSPFHTPQ
jgi:hypothetical protein